MEVFFLNPCCLIILDALAGKSGVNFKDPCVCKNSCYLFWCLWIKWKFLSQVSSFQSCRVVLLTSCELLDIRFFFLEGKGLPFEDLRRNKWASSLKLLFYCSHVLFFFLCFLYKWISYAFLFVLFLFSLMYFFFNQSKLLLNRKSESKKLMVQISMVALSWFSCLFFFFYWILFFLTVVFLTLRYTSSSFVLFLITFVLSFSLFSLLLLLLLLLFVYQIL